MNRRLEQHARNEALMREVNERIEKVDKAAEEATDLGRGQMHFDFLCECGNGSAAGCAEHIEMTLEEYEEVRSEDDRFALYPGHEDEALERVIRRTEKFVIVDKKAADEPFVEDDPRGAPSQ